MARITLRDVIDQAIQRAWESGAEAALIHAGFDSRVADRTARRSEDPGWIQRAQRDIRRQQELARREILAALESAVASAVEQARLPSVGSERQHYDARADVDLAHSIGLEF